jgi:hypothetical protein
MLLADDIVEGLGAVFTGKDFVAHGGEARRGGRGMTNDK